MALERQIKSLPFTEGPDTKTDPILSAKPSRVENAVIRGGTWKKRWGTSQLTALIDTGESFTVGEGLFAFDSELVRINSGTAYSLGPATGKWTTKPGGGQTATHTAKRIIRNSRSQTDADHVYTNGVTVSAWAETAGPSIGLHIAVYDEVTGEFYQTGGAIVSGVSSALGCRCVALGNKVLVFYSNAATLNVAIVDTTSPATAPTVVTSLKTDLYQPVANGGAFDAVASPTGGYAVVAYVWDNAGTISTKLFAVNSLGAVLASPATTDMGETFEALVSIYVAASGLLYVFPHGNNAYFLTANATTLAKVLARTTINNAVGSRTLVAVAEATAGSLTVFMSGSGGAAATASLVATAVVNSAGIGTAYAAINGTAGIAIQGDGFILNGQAACLVMNGATFSGAISLQPTLFVLTATGAVAARILPGTAGNNSGLYARPSRPFTTTMGGTAMLVFERGRLNYTSAAGVTIDKTPIGVTRINLQAVKASVLPMVRLGDAMYIGGSRPSVYDGQEWTDAGFNMFPTGVSAVAAAGGVLSAGTYQYRVLYSWQSVRGELQRSAPSPAVSVTVTATQKVTLTIPTMRLSNRDATAVNQVQIEVYRTEANGTVFYRLSRVDSPLMNDLTASTVSFVDDSTLNVPDTALISNELIYTTGGVYDNIAPPAYRFACAHKNRLIIAGLEDPYEWRSSCQAIRGEMLRFNEAWGGRVPSQNGQITGVASLDNSLIIFVERGAYVVLGDGPDLLGNNPWLPPQPITSVTTGPVSAQSINSINAGVLFQNSQGFQLLDRSLNVQYIGADVEAYAGYNVRCATLRPEVSQLWIQADQGSDMVGGVIGGELQTSNGGVCLVYDYFYGQWSVLTNYGGQSAAFFQSKYCRMRSDGTCFQEQPGTYRDSGTYVATTIETGWVKLAGLQGFQRVWEAGLVGAYGGAGNDFTLSWSIGYDYNTAYNSTYTATYNTAGIFASGDQFQIQRQMPVQKCEAIRFKITDSPSGNGQGIALTDLTLLVAVKGGSNRLPSTKTL